MGKKKDVTCYICGKTGHYSNGSDVEEEDTVKMANKKGSNFLVLKEEQGNTAT